MPKLYFAHASPPSRAVLIALEALGIKYEAKEINLQAKEHLTPEFLKINPQHTVPVFVDDNGLIITDSHAALTYLVSKYGKSDNLYPKEIKQRAIVDQRLHFDNGVLFPRLLNVVLSVLAGNTSIDPKQIEDLHEAYGFLETQLEGKKFIAGENVTVADYSLITSLGSIAGLVPVDPEKYPKVIAWSKRVEALPEFAVSKKGLEIFHSFKSKLEGSS